MSERVMRNPRYEIVPDGNDVLLRFRVPGSKFGTITISLLDADARNFLDVLAAALVPKARAAHPREDLRLNERSNRWR